MTTAHEGDTVKVHYVGTLEDGTVFDSSVDRDPIEFTIGEQQVIPGFESAVVGLTVGETRSVTVAPEDGYGPRMSDRVVVVDRDKLPKGLMPKPGMMLEGRAPEGTVVFTVTGVRDDDVTLDANHPLAGKSLHFEVELIEIG